MNTVEESNKTLLRVEQNDPKLKTLTIRIRNHTSGRIKGCFWLHDGADLSRLGNAIANNTNLKKISFYKSSEPFNKAFFGGLKRNTTITQVWMKGGIDNEVLDNYVANNSNLTEISIRKGDVRGGVARSLASAVKKCSNLNNLDISMCKIDDASLKDIALGVRGISGLKKLYLWNSLTSSNASYIGIGSAESI